MDGTAYRCYYDDGTIEVNQTECPVVNSNGSPLVTSELTIIENVSEPINWYLIAIGLGLFLMLTSKKG